MRQVATILGIASFVALGAARADACEGQDNAAIKNVSVDEVASLMSSKSTVAIYDANNNETREKYGVVPGAKLLSHYADYQATELPADKNAQLVFYCGSEKCSSAPKAAKKAAHQGYKNVSVMKAGIKGWVAAGKSVQKPAVQNAPSS
jgi:rhodanese-related sulfurtransferase